MLGFSPLASKAIADDGIVRIVFNANDIVTGAPTISTPSLKVFYNFTSGQFNIGAPSIDTPTFTINYGLTSADIALDIPIVDSARMLGVPALSRVNIDYETSLVLTESRTDIVIDNDGAASFVILEVSDMLAEVT